MFVRVQVLNIIFLSRIKLYISDEEKFFHFAHEIKKKIK